MQPEIYKSIKNMPLYEISNYGNIRSWKNNRHGKAENHKPITTRIGTTGYLIFSVSINRFLYTRKIHTIVAQEFIGPRPNKMDVCHNDGNRLNNNVSNLRYATRIQNFNDMIGHGRRNTILCNPFYKKRMEIGWPQQQIADFLGLNVSTISGYETGKHRYNKNTLNKIMSLKP